LKINSTLTSLDLSEKLIKVGVIAETLKVNSALTSLDLSANNIEDEGAIAIAEALKEKFSLNQTKSPL